MIKYALICDKGHDFESWFPDSEAFETQAKRGYVECPMCQSKHVSKALMAPAVSTSRRKSAVRAPEPAASETVAAEAPTSPMALLDEQQAAMRMMIRDLHKKLTENSADVGENFSREARAMHEGDAPRRSIHGKASWEEAKELAEEGIPVLPLPSLPDERN